MQQRRPRLGDVLDDYCPRERRVTNHVVVAMIEDEVKQTRCSTCDADHEYKQARVPSPRRSKTVAAIQEGAEAFEAKPVLAPPRPADASSVDASSADVSTGDAPAPPDLDEPAEAPIAPEYLNTPGEPVPLAGAGEGEGSTSEPTEEPHHEDEGPVHRRLIRATLPRPEGHVPERKEPEFTIRQPGSRSGGREVDGNSVGYRPKGGGQRQGGFGHGGGGHSRFGGQRHGSGPQQRHGGGRGPNNAQRGGRQDGVGNARGQQRGPGSGRRRGGR
jgi:hypothetical protein